MTNEDADYYLMLYDGLTKQVEEGLIDKFKIDMEEKTVYIEKTIVPKVAVKHIDMDITITPSGVTWGGF